MPSENKIYKVDTETITTMEQLHEAFPDGVDYTLNWLFLATSGIHGSYATLDQMIQEIDFGQSEPYPLTVLVVVPRRVYVRYGVVPVTMEDVIWLREVVTSTIQGIIESQRQNTLDQFAKYR